MFKNSEKGQATIEAILIVTVLLTTSLAVMNQIRQRQILPSLVEKPWAYISGMIENGVWAPPERGAVNHPNHLQRHATPRGDTL